MKNATHKFVAVCIGAPLMALMVAAPTAFAAPCDASCGVGGASGGNGGIKSGGKANGGQVVGPRGGTFSGTVATNGPTSSGRIVTAPDSQFGAGTLSGNFTTLPGKGHCTGGLTQFC
ncbi:hypothetical protein GGC64_006466 [Mycobacterium sp. OAS707]|uniref:hypothetical protein n=1 Tax=unclassified Mycobacterium TaxID=2642494 RepID=UPI00178A7650|nr:hypothetical protein [Mycobacterium sp. OAS707]MBE1552379.1 hypothetical protein [Mycobacterium sp. OAS707]